MGRRSRLGDFTLLTWIRYMRVGKKIGSDLREVMGNESLSRHQFGLLLEIYHSEGEMQQDYAEKLQVTKGNIVQHLDRLETRGFIERRREGRSNLIYLATAGITFVEKIMPLHDDTVRKYFSKLSQNEIKELYGLLKKLDRA
jgi:DNA-binding MarR family transcriptional regulator